MQYSRLIRRESNINCTTARSETAYHALFGVLTCVLIAAVAIYSRSRDVKPSDGDARAGQGDG